MERTKQDRQSAAKMPSSGWHTFFQQEPLCVPGTGHSQLHWRVCLGGSNWRASLWAGRRGGCSLTCMALHAPLLSLRAAVLLALLGLGSLLLLGRQSLALPEATGPAGGAALVAAAPARPHYRAVLVVLASTNAPFYLFCRSAWLALAGTALQHGVRVVLLYGSGALSAQEETPFDLVVDFVDTAVEWGGAPPELQIVNKTLLALPALLERCTFDYMVRTNIHTFWDAQRLAGRLAALPSSGCLAGCRMDWVAGLSFVDGIDFIISADLVQPMVSTGRSSPARYSAFAEDIAMSVIVHGLLEVPILDTWYGEPGGKGPLLFFLRHGLTREEVCACPQEGTAPAAPRRTAPLRSSHTPHHCLACSPSPNLAHPAVEDYLIIFRYGFDHVRHKPWPVTSLEGARGEGGAALHTSPSLAVLYTHAPTTHHTLCSVQAIVT